MPPIYPSQTSSREYQSAPAGTHFAICNMVVDIGVQATTYQGEEKETPQLILRWEIPDERVKYEKDGEEREGPQGISATYSNYLSEKANLRKVVEGFLGRKLSDAETRTFDISQLAGKACLIMVTHKPGKAGKVYANVTGVMQVGKSDRERAKTAKPEIPVLVYSPSEHDQATYERLPKWIKDKLAQRIDEKAMVERAVGVAGNAKPDFDDDIPF